MIWSDWLTRNASFFQASATIAANLWVQSAVLAAAGIAAARCFRRRGAAVESAVLRATLVAVLLVPLASWVLAAAGVNGLRVSLPQATAPAQQVVKTREPDPLPVPIELPAPIERAPSADFGPAAPAPDDSHPGQIALIDPRAGPAPTMAVAVVAQPTQAVSPRRGPMSVITIVYAVSSAVRFAVAGVLLGRLAVAHLLMSLTRRRAVPAAVQTSSPARGAGRGRCLRDVSRHKSSITTDSPTGDRLRRPGWDKRSAGPPSLAGNLDRRFTLRIVAFRGAKGDHRHFQTA